MFLSHYSQRNMDKKSEKGLTYFWTETVVKASKMTEMSDPKQTRGETLLQPFFSLGKLLASPSRSFRFTAFALQFYV